jgi:hypothetical protein
MIRFDGEGVDDGVMPGRLRHLPGFAGRDPRRDGNPW